MIRLALLLLTCLPCERRDDGAWFLPGVDDSYLVVVRRESLPTWDYEHWKEHGRTTVFKDNADFVVHLCHWRRKPHDLFIENAGHDVRISVWRNDIGNPFEISKWLTAEDWIVVDRSKQQPRIRIGPEQ